MASTAEIRNGLTIRFNNDIYEIVEFQHVKPGKGNAFIRTRLRSMTNGRVLDNTFPSGAKLDDVRIERRKYQFLYPEADQLVFMDTNTFEQIQIPKTQIPGVEFLKEGMECDVASDAETDTILTVEIPTFIVDTIDYTEPGLRGDTATNTLKPARLASGVEIRVPLFIDMGEVVKVDTRTKSYVERVNR